MLKKSATLLIALTVACGSFAAHAAAATKLETSVDSHLGIKYKYGGDTTRGFDCSGFTRFIFAKFGIDLPRTSAGQAGIGEKVAKADLRPGDLVFFNTNGRSISHVGIYMGGGKFAHASTSLGTTITPLNDKYYAKRYVTARRVLDDNTYRKIAAEAAAEAAAPAAAVGEPAAPEAIVIAAPETAVSDEAAVAVSDELEQAAVIEALADAVGETAADEPAPDAEAADDGEPSAPEPEAFDLSMQP